MSGGPFPGWMGPAFAGVFLLSTAGFGIVAVGLMPQWGSTYFVASVVGFALSGLGLYLALTMGEGMSGWSASGG